MMSTEMMLLTEEEKAKVTEIYRPVIKKLLHLTEWQSVPQLAGRLQRAGATFNLTRLCAALIEMHKAGEIQHQVNDCSGWKIPEFKLHPAKEITSWHQYQMEVTA